MTIALNPWRRRWLFVWLLPLMWLIQSWASSHHSGDEHGMFLVSALAAAWIALLIDLPAGLRSQVPYILLAGALSFAVLGLVLDLLRASFRVWRVLFVLAAVAVCVTLIASFPSYDKAISKNGSLLAYVFFSLNAALYIAGALMLIIAPLTRAFRRRPKAGYCAQCGYNLTGNTSGRCPECGVAVPAHRSNRRHGSV